MITDLENEIADKIFIKIEKWNLYLGDAGLARKLAIECLSNLEKSSFDAARISLDSIYVKIGDQKESLPLIKFITPNQITDLEEILDRYK
tara:strand:- start:176 stop:445 length:270 start_codon:yes stop_codon:yes gene_type:complete